MNIKIELKGYSLIFLQAVITLFLIVNFDVSQDTLFSALFCLFLFIALLIFTATALFIKRRHKRNSVDIQA